jgi:hypothetical protein
MARPRALAVFILSVGRFRLARAAFEIAVDDSLAEEIILRG